MRHFHVDRVVDIEIGVRAIGLKMVALSDDVFESHFPGNPILPGVHIIEGLAQTAGVLLTESTKRERFALMASIDRARFAHFARPGDAVRFLVEIESLEEASARVRVEATVGDRAIASARITFRLLPVSKFIPEAFRPHWEQGLANWRGEYPTFDDE